MYADKCTHTHTQTHCIVNCSDRVDPADEFNFRSDDFCHVFYTLFALHAHSIFNATHYAMQPDECNALHLMQQALETNGPSMALACAFCVCVCARCSPGIMLTRANQSKVAYTYPSHVNKMTISMGPRWPRPAELCSVRPLVHV